MTILLAKGEGLEKIRVEKKHEQIKRAYIAKIMKAESAYQKKEEQRDELNDLGPNTTVDINPLKGVDSTGFADDDIDLTVELESAALKIGFMKARYEEQFGEKFPNIMETVKSK